MANTKIEWANKTDNIITVEGGGWWCQRRSAGCANCYSEATNQNSFFGGNKLAYEGVPPKLILKRWIMRSWQRMRVSKVHFVNSMTDTFGEWVDREWHFEIFTAMYEAPKQFFLLLTKRPEVMAIAVDEWLKINNLEILPKNIAVGTSTENEFWLQVRAPILAKIPAKIHFLSVEPLIGSLGDMAPYLSNIQSVIIGGESGKNSRPCHMNWIRGAIATCSSLNIPIFVKQIGSFPVDGTERYYQAGNQKVLAVSRHGDSNNAEYLGNIHTGLSLRDYKGGDISEWDYPLQIRQLPEIWLEKLVK